MNKKINFLLKFGTIFILVAGFALYGLYKAEVFREGPEIAVNEPRDGQTVKNSFVEISGTAKNISSISIDGRPIFTDEKGFFRENLLLAKGYNIIEVQAADKFGKKIKKIIRVVLK